MFCKPTRGMIVKDGSKTFVVIKARPILLHDLETDEVVRLSQFQWQQMIGPKRITTLSIDKKEEKHESFTDLTF